MLYIGIDPGSKGGIAIIDEDIKVRRLFQMSRDNLIEMAKYIEEQKEFYGLTSVACVEKVNAMPGQGVTSMFSFGKGAGFIEGVIERTGIPYQLIPPQKWKKEFGLIHQDKNKSIDTARNLFPDANLYATTRSRKESDGLAESLLMAEYARRRM